MSDNFNKRLTLRYFFVRVEGTLNEEGGGRVKKQVLFAGLCLLLILLSLSIGSSSQFVWSDIFKAGSFSQTLFLESRLPRTMAILLSAGAISLSGLLMQTVTQNRFAAPSTTGTVEAAQLGMLVSLFFFPQASLWQKMLFAFAGAMVATLVFVQVIRRFSFREKWMLPLVGMIYGGMIGAGAQIIAFRYNLVQSMTSWRQGSFAMIQTQQYEWLYLTVILFAAVWYFTETFTIMSLGEETSRSLGLPFYQMEGFALFLVALTTAVTMITVGSLPFLGVIVPNLARQFKGDHLKHSRSLVFWMGCCLVLACDILARLVVRPYEVSVSVVLGVIGSVVFVSLLWKERVHD